MARFSSRWEREFRSIREAARRWGLSSAETERLLRDARQGVERALSAGLAPRDVRVLLTSDGAGSVALFVGDAASVVAASHDREAAAMAALPPASRALH